MTTEIIFITNHPVITSKIFEFQEIKVIRESRETCGCSCKDYCKPDTCECVINDIGIEMIFYLILNNFNILVLLQNVRRKEMGFPAAVGPGVPILMARESLMWRKSPCTMSIP